MAETCDLLVITNQKDKDGFPVEVIDEIEAYVLREKSVRHSEFYEAFAVDMEARYILELRVEEWEESAHFIDDRKEYATKVRYEDCVYDVARTYKKNKSIIEVTLAIGKKVTSWR